MYTLSVLMALLLATKLCLIFGIAVSTMHTGGDDDEQEVTPFAASTVLV